MPTAKKPTKKTPVARKTKTAERRVKPPQYKSFRLSKRIKHPGAKIRPSWRIFWASLKHLRKNWRPFTGIIFIYLLLTVLLVKGLTSDIGLSELKLSLEEVFGGSDGMWLTSLTLFSVLLGSAGSAASEVASAYQSMLLIIMSLAIIWTLRQTYAGTKVKTKVAFYRGLYPLVPFVLILLVIGLQLIPLAVAGVVYGIVIEGGLAVTMLEKTLWVLLLGLVSLLSLYMITSSSFALYIVTLPDMTPMKALRSAREIVRFRRWIVMRKLLFLPLILIIFAAMILLPVIMFATPIAEWVFFVLNMGGLAIIHSYFYSLYRELL